MTQKTAVIYARQSFGEQDSASIEVQREACQKWAQAHNVTVIGEYVDANTSSEHYPLCDEGIEAARIDKGYQMWRREQRTKGRKEFKEGLGKAFEAIRASRPDYLLVYTTNRLGRSATNSNLNNFLTAYLMEHNCSIVDVQNGSITDFSDRVMLAFRAMRDALDYQGLAEKRKASIESVSKRINSYTKWSNAFGVKMLEGQVTFLPEHAKAIKMIFEKIAGGTAYPAMIKILNDPEYRGLWSGKQCYPTNLTSILKNPTYCGYMTNREGVLDRAVNIPEPVISYSLWREVQNIVASKKVNCGKYNLAGQKKRHWLPFSGWLRCSCGRRMTMRVDRGIVSYECQSPDHMMRLAMVDKRTGNDFVKTIGKLFIINAIESRKELLTMGEASARIDSLKHRIEKVQEEIRAKFRLVVDDQMYDLFKPEIEAKKAEIVALKDELAVEESKLTADIAGMKRSIEEDFAACMDGDLPEETYQRLLLKTVDGIVVHKDRIAITLTSGKQFDLPRVVGKWHAKRLPEAEIYATAEDPEDLMSVSHYDIVFTCNENWTNETVLLEDEAYTVFLRQ